MINFVFFLILGFSVVTAQDFNYYCPEPPIAETAEMSQIGGLYKPSMNAPNEFFRILVVFVQFSGDNRYFSDWQYGQLPTYSNYILDSIKSYTYKSMSISDYWKTMSQGNFDVIGDIYPYIVTLPPESSYIAQHKWFQDCNMDVLDSINYKLDFKKYDNWELKDGEFIFTPREADSTLDMMYIIYRNPGEDTAWFGAHYGKFGGIAILGDDFTKTMYDGTKIDGNYLSHKASGITIRYGAEVYYPDALGGLNHELGHYLFGGNHTKISGLMPGAPYSYKGSTYALSGWESERLGYCAFTTVTQDNFTITLQDYLTYGQILKIPITANNYFLVENHQRLNKYDQIMRGGSILGAFDTTTSLGKGIYIWKIKGGNSYPPDVDIKSANGNWNWSLVGSIPVGGGWPDSMPLSARTAINRDLGKSDRHPQNIYWNYDGKWGWWEKWHDTIPLTKELEIRRNIMGLEMHAWNYNYTRIFSPWSNPSTYFDGTTNTAMQIYSENGANITLKIFNTLNSCLALPPSKPQWLKITANGNCNPVLNWEKNIEPSMKYAGQYKIFRCGTTGGEPTNFIHVATIDAFDIKEPITTWTDVQMTVGGSPDKLFYKISAVDNSAQESMRSDYDWITYDHTAQKIITKTGFEMDYILDQNYPNPFNPVTNIHFTVKEPGRVQIKVYDILGNEIQTVYDQFREVGSYTIRFDAGNLTSGVYIYTINVNDFVQSRKMTLLR